MSFDIEANGKFDNASFSLNPFGTGQCLSTEIDDDIKSALNCLNPFGTGQCLSTSIMAYSIDSQKSQSLWNRAMSFDEILWL